MPAFPFGIKGFRPDDGRVGVQAPALALRMRVSSSVLTP